MPFSILHTGNPDGSVSAKLQNPAVSNQVLENIFSWRAAGMSEDAIFSKLRQDTVPSGYTIHNWTPGDLIITR